MKEMELTEIDSVPYNKREGSYHKSFSRMEVRINKESVSVYVSECVTLKDGDSPRLSTKAICLDKNQVAALIGHLSQLA